MTTEKSLYISTTRNINDIKCTFKGKHDPNQRRDTIQCNINNEVDFDICTWKGVIIK